MKHLLFLTVCILAFSMGSLAQTTETFDVATFQPPRSWTRSARADAIMFSTENKDDYCVIMLYRSIPGLSDPQENFDAAWATIVKEAVDVSTVEEMIPADKIGDWQVLGGFGLRKKMIQTDSSAMNAPATQLDGTRSSSENIDNFSIRIGIG